MANIITDIAGLKSVRMTNGRFARPPAVAVFTTWTTIRVALYIRGIDSGAAVTGTPRLALGLCAGNANIMGDATTTHFAGVITNSASWTRNAGPPVSYSITLAQPCKQVGATLTLGTTLSNLVVHTANDTMMFLDITVGSPNYSFRSFLRTNTTAPTNTYADYVTQSLAGTPTFTGYTYAAAQTVAVDEATDGTFDHVNVWWNQLNPSFDVLDIRVFKVA